MSLHEYIDSITLNKGLKGKIKKRLYRPFLVGFEIIDALISDLQKNQSNFVQHDEYVEQVNELRGQINELRGQINELRGQIGNSFQEIREGLGKGFSEVNQRIDAILLRMDNNDIVQEDKYRIYSEEISKLRDDIKFITAKNILLSKKIYELKNANVLSEDDNTANDKSVIPKEVSVKEDKYDTIDYFDFENHFRGSIDSIKERQKIYLKYFLGKKNILDIGCGRGEMLSLLTENNITCKGIDIYEEYAEYCCAQGLNVVAGDGISYLANSREKYGGIFVGQVVEHISVENIVRLCESAYEKLEEGACIIMETPNPCCLAIYTNAFYMDPSHMKPVHPATLKYFLEKAGFTKVEIVFTEASKVPYVIPELDIVLPDNSENNLKKFNEAMHEVSNLLFGSQDYAIIATK